MISRIEGIAAEVENDGVIVMVGGLGLKVFTPQPLLNEIEAGKPVALRTHLIVKEDLLALYGFKSEDELNMFTLLLGVSGVGPKLALSILSNSTTDAIRRAVVQEQPDYLARIPGLGKKTAQKVVLHLQGKISEPAGGGLAELHNTDYEVVEALTALGYSNVQAQTAVQSLPKNTPDDVEEKLRLALQSLA